MYADKKTDVSPHTTTVKYRCHNYLLLRLFRFLLFWLLLCFFCLLLRLFWLLLCFFCLLLLLPGCAPHTHQKHLPEPWWGNCCLLLKVADSRRNMLPELRLYLCGCANTC